MARLLLILAVVLLLAAVILGSVAAGMEMRPASVEYVSVSEVRR